MVSNTKLENRCSSIGLITKIPEPEIKNIAHIFCFYFNENNKIIDFFSLYDNIEMFLSIETNKYYKMEIRTFPVTYFKKEKKIRFECIFISKNNYVMDRIEKIIK